MNPPPPFSACSAAVRPGGLLVLELPHPAELWGGYCLDDEQYVEAWDAQVGRKGGWLRWVGASRAHGGREGGGGVLLLVACGVCLQQWRHAGRSVPRLEPSGSGRSGNRLPRLGPLPP